MPLSCFKGIPRAELAPMVVDGETIESGTFPNFTLTTQLLSGGPSLLGGAKLGGLPLTKLMIDAHQSRAHVYEPRKNK